MGLLILIETCDSQKVALFLDRAIGGLENCINSQSMLINFTDRLKYCHVSGKEITVSLGDTLVLTHER